MGGIYKRGNTFWIKYYRAGKPYRESSKSSKESDAKKLLKLREGNIVEGRFHGLKVEKILFDELAEDLITDYKINGMKSTGRAQQSIDNLKHYFSGMRTIDITTDKVKGYIAFRKKGEIKNATINRELSALKRMFNLGTQNTPPKVITPPRIPHLKENNSRTGFFEYTEYKALKVKLPDQLKPVVTTAFFTGMRKEEILTLEWIQVDLIEGKITLKAANTKNNEARIIFMESELLETIRFQKTLRDSKFPLCPYVFFNEKGERMMRFDRSWTTACKKAGLEGRLFHDFRRTGVRNMVRAGVPERVAMMISGHKTRSIFERYNIVNEEDLKKASRQVAEYNEKQKESALSQEAIKNGHNMGTIEEKRSLLEQRVEPVIN